MPPVLLTPAQDHHKRNSVSQRRKQALIRLAAGATRRAQTRRVRPDGQRGSVVRVPGAGRGCLQSRRIRPLLLGVLTGSAEIRAPGPADVPRALAEPPPCASVFSGCIEARPAATELLPGSAERSKAAAGDYFCAAATLATTRKLLGLCNLQTKTTGRVSVSPNPKKRPVRTPSTHG